MSTDNVGLWSKLNVDFNKDCFFIHPSNSSLKVFVFADVPHLIKLVRNHLLDSGFWVNHCLIDRTCFEKLTEISTSDLSIAYKITHRHLQLKGSERQKVRPAVQLLSKSVATAIDYIGKNGFFSVEPWQEVSNFVKLINDWYDVFNSKIKYVANDPSKNAYGTELKTQRHLLHQVTNIISKMRVGKHQTLIPFQKGIILSNNSLEHLYDYLNENYNLEYIITSRLNQDILENLFSYIRGMGVTNDHPHPLDFKYRLRWFILGKNSDALFTENTNTEELGEQCLIKLLEQPYLNSDQMVEYCMTSKILEKLPLTQIHSTNPNDEKDDITVPGSFIGPYYPEIGLAEDCVCDNETMQILEDFEFKEKINEEALKYIAGYVAYKFKDKYNLGVKTSLTTTSGDQDWIACLSRGGLLHPKDNLMEAAKILEHEFCLLHRTTLSKQSQIFKILADKVFSELKDNSNISYEVIYYFCRTRTYIRLKYLNDRISFENNRRKMEKKLSKFINCKI